MKTIKILLLLLIPFTIISCLEDDFEPPVNIEFSVTYTIKVDNNKLLISGYEYSANRVATKYWIDSEVSDSTTFVNTLSNSSVYREPVDYYARSVYVHKKLDGELDVFKFDQGTLIDGGKVFYYKNDEVINMDTTALGTIATMCILNDKPFFAGYFGEKSYSAAGMYLLPKTPFFWDGSSEIVELPIPENTTFKDVSCIYVSEENDFYVGGYIGLPMYWKNTEPVILGDLYGIVYQITTSGTDEYAVGFYNKYNSNSTAHTACYWKNGELHEIEDNAQAFGIYIDGDDIYVSGSIGRVPSEYKACYWKNGVRTELPL